MRKVYLLFFLAVASPLSGEDYQFSERPFDEQRGIVAFNHKSDDKLYLVLSDLKNHSSKQIEIGRKSSSPTLCADAVAVCSYGDGKIVLYDYELQPLCEVVLGKGFVPVYSSSSSDGRLLYVFVTQFENGVSVPHNFVYKYALDDGKLAFDSLSSVEPVGKIVTYKDSVFVVNQNSCVQITFKK